jgi:thiosulfate reductase cytochrome b subunit
VAAVDWSDRLSRLEFAESARPARSRPTRDQLEPRHIWRDIADHTRLRLPRGEAAARYNILQKFAYLGVIFLLLPLLILTA